MLTYKSGHKRRFLTKGKTRYSTKKYTNPFFSNQPQRQRLVFFEISKKIKIIIILIFFVLVGIFWFIFYADYFNIKYIEVSGQGRINEEDIELLAWRQINDNFLIILPHKNIFYFKKAKLKSEMEKKYSFNSFSIEKKPPNKIIINYHEKDYVMIWLENNNYYYASEEGYIIAEADLLEISQKDYPLIENLSQNNIFNNMVGVEPKYYETALKIFSQAKKYDYLNIEKLYLDKEINSVKIKIESGPDIYFNTDMSLEKQFFKITTVKEEKLGGDFVNKKYIDVRYGDSIYYR